MGFVSNCTPRVKIQSCNAVETRKKKRSGREGANGDKERIYAIAENICALEAAAVRDGKLTSAREQEENGKTRALKERGNERREDRIYMDVRGRGRNEQRG